MVNFGIQWRGKWQRYPCCISSRPWARLPKLTLHPSRVKDVHNSRLRLGFQNRYRLSNEYSTTGRHIFPMIRIRERRECLSKLLTTSAKQRLSQSTSNLVDRTWPLKPSFLFLATRRSWWWHNCIAPIAIVPCLLVLCQREEHMQGGRWQCYRDLHCDSLKVCLQCHRTGLGDAIHRLTAHPPIWLTIRKSGEKLKTIQENF